MSQPVLKTARLTLRPFAPEDAQPLHTFFTDPLATRYWGDVHDSFEQTRAFVESTITGDPAQVCDFVIERKGQAIGKAGMWGRPEIGFFILPAHQRKGYAGEALRAIIPHLFAAYGIDKLIAETDPENAASLALLGGLGFRIVGRRDRTIRIAGRWCDSIDLSLTRADWDARA